jgi:hypothetical protein
MKTIGHMIKIIFIAMTSLLWAGITLGEGAPIEFNDLHIHLSSDWSLVQQANDNGKGIFVTENNSSQVTLYSEEQALPDFQTFFAQESEVITPESMFNINAFPWRIIEVKYRNELLAKDYYIFGFGTFYSGRSYYGYARGTTQQVTRKDALNFIKLVHSK